MEENLRQKPTNILKITLYGPESTGKTTLSRQLAEHFNTVWIPEFARDFLQEILDKEGRVCEEYDLLPIAIGQIKLENEALEKANRFLFCDTNSLVTKAFSDIYYNHCSEELEEAARLHEYDLFFLTDIDVPWEDDGLRDSAEYRDQAFDVFKQELQEYNKPFILISGDVEERLQKAIKIVTDLEKALAIGLTSKEFVELFHQNKNIDYIATQIQNIKTGISSVAIEKPAVANDGILCVSSEDFSNFCTFYENNIQNFSVEKFVPASGAASRMFKFLSEFINDFNPEKETINGYINRTNNSHLSTFIIAMDKFPFFDEVDSFLNSKHSDFKSFSKDKKNYMFIQAILNESSFNFVNKPKGILPFHKYDNKIVTPVEEHLKEVLEYASTATEAFIHFTISEEHQNEFEICIKNIKPSLEKEYSKKINYSFSYQDETTDSVSLNEQLQFIKQEGNLVFRPAGHGALLHNLNERNSDIVYIKNIDNVSHNNLKQIALYKKGLGGILIEKQQQIFDFLNQLHQADVNKETINASISFVENDLKITTPTHFEDYKKEAKIKFLKTVLDKPIRVCGMVKNENEPGGGPFWIKDKNGEVSLQIVESAQIDFNDPTQAKLFNSATHFNPVDLVCGIKNYKGEKFDLFEFTNPETGFIVEKSKNGINQKAYELPGLWNGSMANWITIFVEVPIATFNPVKTVNDLLKPNHQPQ